MPDSIYQATVKLFNIHDSRGGEAYLREGGGEGED